MTHHVSPAIIMRVKEFGETDLLVTFFTPDRGLQKGVAKGARRSRKRFVNCLDVCSLVNLEYEKRGEGDLCFLNSGKLVNAFPGLRSDFATLSKASFMIELTEILFPLGVTERKMFTLLEESLKRLAEGEMTHLIHIFFEARAMVLAGYGIDFSKCAICGRDYKGLGPAVFKREAGGIACLKCARPSRLSPSLRPESVRLLDHMQAGAPGRVGDPVIDRALVDEIKSVLKLHREYHLGLRPRTAAYLD